MSCKEFYDAGFSSFEEYVKAFIECYKKRSFLFPKHLKPDYYLELAEAIYNDNRSIPEPIIKEVDIPIAEIGSIFSKDGTLKAEIEQYFNITDPRDEIAHNMTYHCPSSFGSYEKVNKITINEELAHIEKFADIFSIDIPLPVMGNIIIKLEGSSHYGKLRPIYKSFAILDDDRTVSFIS